MFNENRIKLQYSRVSWHPWIYWSHDCSLF